MLTDSMKSEELSSLGNSLCSPATGTWTNCFCYQLFQAILLSQNSSMTQLLVAKWIFSWSFSWSICTFFPQVIRMLSLEKPSYGQIMALYSPYSYLDKNMLRGYAIWQMLSFPLMKKPHKCILKMKLAMGQTYSLLILLELFHGLRQKNCSMSLLSVPEMVKSPHK